jgi:hypothetical protein
MQRLRKHITPATVIATVALVFAMTGGAYAAGAFKISSTKQISPKVLKALKGANGKNGANGAAGAQGPAGPAGAVGPAGPGGAAGGAGAKGENGKDGKDGKDGKEGKEGSPWTDGGTLPSKATETGTWSFSGPGPSIGNIVLTHISFPIQLPAPLEGSNCGQGGPCHVHFITTTGEEIGGLKETQSKACKGTAAEPTAEPGNLCLYEQERALLGVEHEEGDIIITSPGTPFPVAFPQESASGAGTTGAIIYFKGESETANFGYGSWAVTAE